MNETPMIYCIHFARVQGLAPKTWRIWTLRETEAFLASGGPWLRAIYENREAPAMTPGRYLIFLALLALAVLIQAHGIAAQAHPVGDSVGLCAIVLVRRILG
jgi:hypothetical protein